MIECLLTLALFDLWMDRRRSGTRTGCVKKVAEVAHFEGPLKGTPSDPSLGKHSVKLFAGLDSEFAHPSRTELT